MQRNGYGERCRADSISGTSAVRPDDQSGHGAAVPGENRLVVVPEIDQPWICALMWLRLT